MKRIVSFPVKRSPGSRSGTTFSSPLAKGGKRGVKRFTGALSALRAVIVFIACVGLSGCTWGTEQRERLDLGVGPTTSPIANSVAYRDTIGAYTYYDGLRPMRVRGYGLVAGLGKDGSRDCPRHVRNRLIQAMYKQHRFTSSVLGEERVTPEALIDDLSTAVVVVRAEIPPVAVRGFPFDVAVAALPGTQTKSLRGGRLYTTDLEVFRPVSSTVSITGQVLAKAAGPVFQNPFSEQDAATRSSPLEGIIVGGGRAIHDRRIRLVLTEPSYQRATQIQNRINAHFSGSEKIADAQSPSFVRLRVPEGYREDTGHFLALVRGLYLARNPQFAATRARLLAEEIIHPTAPHALISVAFEGLGRAALPELNRLCAHPKDYVSFHAGVAGLRLGDHIASDTMVVHAEKAASDFRFQAIRALGGARGMAGAAIALRKLLDDPDPRVQIAAYEALISRRDSAILSIPIAGDNFILDEVAATGPSFIYAKRSGSRRIVLFGQDLRCMPPLLYRALDGSVTINAGSEDEGLTILRTNTATGSTSSPIPAPLELPGLIHLMGSDAEIDNDGKVLGLGLDYAAVVAAMYNLYKDESINAKFILEQPNVTELFGPLQPEGRPESEL